LSFRLLFLDLPLKKSCRKRWILVLRDAVQFSRKNFQFLFNQNRRIMTMATDFDSGWLGIILEKEKR
jgi:hypothetical protein